MNGTEHSSRGAESRLIWGTIPDFWSISGSGMILGGAIWVAMAKTKIKHETLDDLERNEYEPIITEEQSGEYKEFELGEIIANEDEFVECSLFNISNSLNRNQIEEVDNSEVSLDVPDTIEEHH